MGRTTDRSWSEAPPGGAWAAPHPQHQRETRRGILRGLARPWHHGRPSLHGRLCPSGPPTLLAQPRRRTSPPFQGGLARERTPLALDASLPGPGAGWGPAGRPVPLAQHPPGKQLTTRAGRAGTVWRDGELAGASPLAAHPAMAAAAPSAASAVVPVPRETARTIVSGHEFKCDRSRSARVSQINC